MRRPLPASSHALALPLRYGLTNPGSCNDTFTAGGLTSGTKYFFCAIGSNVAGTAFGTVLSFTTPAAPAVTTSSASDVLLTSATFNGSANPNGPDTGGWFRYGTTNPGTCNDTFGTRAPTLVSASLGAGTTEVGWSEVVSGLTPGATYCCCASVVTPAGKAQGEILYFIIPSGPGGGCGCAAGGADPSSLLAFGLVALGWAGRRFRRCQTPRT